MKTSRTDFVDPGYGDAAAPVGTEPWAQRWRLDFQNVVKNLPMYPEAAVSFYQSGTQNRAWTLVKKSDGRPFRTFEEFCEAEQPWGLGIEHPTFIRYLQARLGERTVQLLTVAPDRQGTRSDIEETPSSLFGTSRTQCGKLDGERLQEKLRAILRADPVIQDLYREGLVSQDMAAKMGPRKPIPERAAVVAEVRQKVERMRRPGEKASEQQRRAFRREVDKTIRDGLGVKTRTALDWLNHWWGEATKREQDAFRKQIGEQ
jgi:hypothetical protein